jgi:hypothetical protein
MLITSFRISEQLTSSAFDDNNLMGRAYISLVINTLKVSGTNIGAGFRAIRRKVTFRHLSNPELDVETSSQSTPA